MSDDYEVGYKKPPKHSQFRKGQSGNRKGRPRKKPYEPPQMTGLGVMDQPIAKMSAEEMFRPVKVANGNGETEEIPAFQAILRSQVHQAAKGNRLAAKQLIELFSSLQIEQQEEKLAVLSAVLDAKKVMSVHPDWPGATFLAENGVDLDRIQIKSNGLIVVDDGPASLTPDQLVGLVVARNQITDNIYQTRELLAFAERNFEREYYASKLKRLKDEFRKTNALLPEDQQIEFPDE